MKNSPRKGMSCLLSFIFSACLSAISAQDNATLIPANKISEIQAALTASKDQSSVARKRLAAKRMVRDASELLKQHPQAVNRFEVLGILFKAQQEIVAADNSTENREAFLETCKQLAAAPDDYASIRFDADLLLTQSQMVRKGADARERANALMPLVERYRGTAVETKVVKVAIVMALELGDTRLVNTLQEVIAERYAGDLEMIEFQRDKLGGQVIGAPFCGVFETSDSKKRRFPLEGLGKTTVLFFWSNDETSLKHLKAIAASEKQHHAECFGRIQIVSFNVDQLPDAGEGILRGLGVDWPALRLPEGRENPHYRTFASRTPSLVSLSPSGQAALVMAGSTRNNSPKTADNSSEPDYSRLFTVSIVKEWANPEYSSRLISLLSGEFFVLDPEGPLDPTLPPECKAGMGSAPLTRDASSVPAEKLLAIQDCFVLPPLRYRMPMIEQKANFEKAEALCAQVIAVYPQAPDLWLVRNRRITALMALWKITSHSEFYERAAAEARLVLESKPPTGADLVARFCLVRETLRTTDANPKAVILGFSTSLDGKAPGPALAAAAMLALEVGDRALHEELRKTILAGYAEHPMLWSPVSFMLCRHSRYWLYQVPFSAGWTYGRREAYFLGLGDPEDCSRTFSAEFKTLDGKTLTLPKDHPGKWSVIFICTGQQGDDSVQMMKNLVGQMKSFKLFTENRVSNDVQSFTAFLDDDAQRVGGYAKEETIGFPILLVPGGIKNPLVQKLGIMAEDKNSNVLVLRPDGTIAAAISGLAMQGRHAGTVVQNVIEWQDEKLVTDALNRGDIEEAKRLALLYAPTEPPVSADPKKKNIKPLVHSLAHLSSRARVYFALKEYDKALADTDEVVSRQIGTDGGMSMRTKELDDAEQMRDKILALLGKTKESR